MQKFKKAFRRLPDPRAANAKHPLLEVVLISLAAVVCGAASCSEISEFGRSKKELLRLFLRLEHGIPSHDTFSRVFRLLDPAAFEGSFRQFMTTFAKANGLKLSGVVAVDGKALRGAYQRGAKATPLHLVNVFAVEARMALAQQKAPGRNETAGALEVLELLCLEGCIVTADALHCNRRFAQAVLDRGGDYALVIKGNRGPLFETVTQQFARSGKRSTTRQIDRATHDRSETRTATVMRNKTLAKRFPGVVAVGQITSRRRLRDQRATRRPFATIFCRNTFRPSGCWTSPVVIGGSRTAFIGSSTSILPRTQTARERTTHEKTLPFCVGSLSTSCVPIPTANPSASKLSVPAGTIPSSCSFSAICDSPSRQRVGQHVVYCRSLAVCQYGQTTWRQIERLLAVASVGSRAGAERAILAEAAHQLLMRSALA